MRKKIDEIWMLERELTAAKKALFRVNTIRELKFLQEKIRYLDERIKTLNNGKR